MDIKINGQKFYNITAVEFEKADGSGNIILDETKIVTPPIDIKSKVFVVDLPAITTNKKQILVAEDSDVAEHYNDTYAQCSILPASKLSGSALLVSSICSNRVISGLTTDKYGYYARASSSGEVCAFLSQPLTNNADSITSTLAGQIECDADGNIKWVIHSTYKVSAGKYIVTFTWQGIS